MEEMACICLRMSQKIILLKLMPSELTLGILMRNKRSLVGYNLITKALNLTVMKTEYLAPKQRMVTL